MHINQKVIVIPLLFSSLLLTLAGCSGKGADTPRQDASPSQVGMAPAIATSPVTLKVLQDGGSLSDEEFKKYFADPIAKKYPNITLELVRSDGKGNSPEELVAAGDFPDFIYTALHTVQFFEKLGVVEDVTPMVKKFALNLDRFQGVALKVMTGYDPNPTQMAGIPINLNAAATVYNKDIFDKFGISYPKDGMSWDEAIALGRKLTRTEDGVSYIGIDPWRVESVGGQLSLGYVDPKTNKATVNTAGWAKVLSIFKEAVDVPGFVNDKKFDYDFFKDNVAMYPLWATGLVSKVSNAEVAKSRSWDLVSLPYVKGYEGKGRDSGAAMLVLSNTSKHKDEAFAVVQEIVSDEVQMSMARDGRISVLKDPSFQKNYLQGNPQFNGKNIGAFFKLDPSPGAPATKYDDKITLMMRSAKGMLALDHKDINTVLRDLQDQADKYIASQQ